MLEYNTPFVNSTETTKLDFDLTKEEVLEILGEPLLVKRGTGSSRTISSAGRDGGRRSFIC